MRAPGQQPRGAQIFLSGPGRPQRLLSVHALHLGEGMAWKQSAILVGNPYCAFPTCWTLSSRAQQRYVASKD